MTDSHWALGEMCFSAQQGFIYFYGTLLCDSFGFQRAPQDDLTFTPLKTYPKSFPSIKSYL